MGPIADPKFEKAACALSVRHALRPDDARAIVLRFGGDAARCDAIADAASALNVSPFVLFPLCK